VRAERAVLNGLGGGCQVPIGAHARIKDGRLQLRGVVARPDGSKVICLEAEGDAGEPEVVGSQLARDLLAAGASELLDVEGR
jgi:hydroxymethylbilane synthase